MFYMCFSHISKILVLSRLPGAVGAPAKELCPLIYGVNRAQPPVSSCFTVIVADPTPKPCTLIPEPRTPILELCTLILEARTLILEPRTPILEPRTLILEARTLILEPRIKLNSAEYNKM